MGIPIKVSFGGTILLVVGAVSGQRSLSYPTKGPLVARQIPEAKSILALFLGYMIGCRRVIIARYR